MSVLGYLAAVKAKRARAGRRAIPHTPSHSDPGDLSLFARLVHEATRADIREEERRAEAAPRS